MPPCHSRVTSRRACPCGASSADRGGTPSIATSQARCRPSGSTATLSITGRAGRCILTSRRALECFDIVRRFPAGGGGGERKRGLVPAGGCSDFLTEPAGGPGELLLQKAARVHPHG